MANENKLAKPKQGPSTKQYLDIAEIRDNTVIMKDGTLRSVILVSSINFALKSIEEQQAIIQAYIQFINALEFPVQIVIQSRKMNIDTYVASLQEQEGKVENPALKNQITDYLGFIKQLVDLGEIMEKRFFVVVPYDPSTDKQKKFFTRLSEALKPAFRMKLKDAQFKERKETLEQRMSTIMGLLGSMGLLGVPLDTQSLIELYYNTYNPEVYDKEHLGEVGELRVEESLAV